MKSETLLECRDRAIIAFLILSGGRDGSIPSFKVRHLDLDKRTVFHDARSVKTKGAKTFVSVLFPVGSQFVAILADYVSRVEAELFFGPDDPLFPAPQRGHRADRGLLSRHHWKNASPIRRVVRNAFEAAGFHYPNPHSVRKALARFGEQKVRNPEEWKAWSQNFGHKNEMTTFRGYGQIPLRRQAEIIRAFEHNSASGGVDEQIAKLEQIVLELRSPRADCRDRRQPSCRRRIQIATRSTSSSVTLSKRRS
jgi:integrase